MKRYGIEEYEVLAEVKGAALENLEIEHPFINKRVPLILGEHVTTEAGTGAVHTAPDHGLDDFYAGRNMGLIRSILLMRTDCSVQVQVSLRVFMFTKSTNK